MTPTEKVSHYIADDPHMVKHLGSLAQTVRGSQVRFPNDALADAIREWFQMLEAENHPKYRKMFANIGSLKEVDWYQVAEGAWR